MRQVEFFLIAGIIFCSYSASFALPLYTVNYRITQCTACHVSATGGGLRNLNGKLFGNHGHEPTFLSEQEYFGADWRLLYFKSQKSKTTREGTGLMEAVVQLNLPISKSTNKVPVRLVFNHSLSGFATDRDTYLQFDLEKTNHFVHFVELGRLQPPFGVRTDEHRTYTRMMTQTTWLDFVMGVGISGEPYEPVHYDFIFLNGESNTTPGQLANNKTNKWGNILNVRWLSPNNSFPVLLGMSGMWLDRLQTDHAWADSLYTLVSLTRWTHGDVPLTLTAEFVQAQNFNVSNSHLTGFVTDQSYLQTVSTSRAQSWLAQLDWEIYRLWFVTYKFEEIILDINFPSDYYQRHGIGGKYFLSSNIFLIARYEFASASHPTEMADPKWGAQSALWAIVQATF